MKSEEKAEEKFVVTPWDTSGKINYDKLVEQFGTEIIDQKLLDRFKKVTGKELHPWMRRKIFFTHRTLEKWLEAYENGEPVFLYTGRGPSTDAMHIGHLIPFMFTKWLQDTFNCPLVIQMSDEEKAAFKNLEFEAIHQMGFENAKEIMSLGFDPEKTFIFSNRDYRLKCPQYESFVTDMKNHATVKSIRNIFGLKETGNIFMYDWPIYQSAAAFYQSYPHLFGNRVAFCLVPYAIDQDPYFRLARDLANNMNLFKPCSIMSKFIPPLVTKEEAKNKDSSEQTGKMSSSHAEGTIFLTDDEVTIRAKVMKCMSNADPDPEIHKQKGANPDQDLIYQYLRFFEYDDNKLNEIKEGFEKGTLSEIEMKEILSQKIIALVKEIQNNRKKINDTLFSKYYEIKPMDLPKPKVKEATKEESELYAYLDKLSIQHQTKYHALISTKDQNEELARSLTGTICKGILLKSKEYIYYIINHQTTITPKLLAKKLGIKSLRFAEADTYTQLLKVASKKCPSPFALVNDTTKQISQVLIDENIPIDKNVCMLAMREDATCTISYKEMIAFIDALKYPFKTIKE